MAGNKIALGAEQADAFKSYFGSIRRNTLRAATLAYDIHSQYISADGKSYAKAFNTWWDAQGLGNLFGTKGNWTKWHQAGKVISQFQQNAELKNHFDKLPLTLTGLAAIHKLTDVEIRLCVQNTYTRTSVTQPETEWSVPKKPKPLINPAATAKQIENWMLAWREPKPKVKKDPRSLTLVSVKVHGNFYNFDKDTAEPTGFTTPDKLRQWVDEVRKVFGKNEEHILVEANAETLISNRDKRQKRTEETIAKRAAKAQKTKKKIKKN